MKVNLRSIVLTSLIAAACGAIWLWCWSDFGGGRSTVLNGEATTVGGTNRSFRLATPAERTGAMPLVVVFHGLGDSPESMAAYSGLDGLAASHGCVVAYPAAVNGMWRVRGTKASDILANPDIAFFDQLLSNLSQRFRLDSNRVYLVGMSNGAEFVHLLLKARASEVAAAVAHSGSSPVPISETAVGPPIMLIAGSQDAFVVDALRSDLQAYQRAGDLAELIVVEGLGHEWSRDHNEVMWRFLCRHKKSEAAAAVTSSAAVEHSPPHR